MLKKYHTICSIVVLIISSSYAQKKENGFYLDVHLAYNSVGSDFNGESALIALDDAFAVPNFEAGIGFGLSVGIRYEELYVELAFQRTEHNYTWVGIKGDATHSIWSMNLRKLFFKDSSVQPFFQLGWMPVMPIRVNDGAFLSSENIISDAIFIGDIANFNVGGGIEFSIKPKISARLNVVYKKARYKSVESSEENVPIKLEEDINANGTNMTLGIVFVL